MISEEGKIEEDKFSEEEKINVWGARVHNLKNIDVEIPRDSLTVITGLSGSGKSSLAFDTIFAEGQRRYIETFSAYARNFLGNMERPDVDKITGLSPVISIEQKTTNKNPRSTVGTTTEIYDYLRLLFARAGTAYSYRSGEEMVKYTEEQVIDMILDEYAGKAIFLLAPLVRQRKGHYRELFESMRRKGYLYVRVDGEIQEVVSGMKLDRYKMHNIEVVIDKLVVKEADEERIRKSVATAMKQGDGMVMVIEKGEKTGKNFSKRLMDPVTGIAYQDPAPNMFSFNSPEGACPHCKGLGKVNHQTGGRRRDLCAGPFPLCPRLEGFFMTNTVFVVGLGPGGPQFLTAQAQSALTQAEVLCGYTVYLDLVRPYFPEKEYYSTGMTQEIDRCRWALETARRGKAVALVCSGDAGVYGMASPLLELAEQFPEVAVEVVPGLTAALSGGAVLGAPLAHDFCVISLSDRLTPWEVIEKRLACAAQGDFAPLSGYVRDESGESLINATIYDLTDGLAIQF